uniref:Uncharacterized protein n=1 Tax=Panagrolaimus sp. JU765 TaxID=591449 RepID=A0AC34RTC0_9BILA
MGGETLESSENSENVPENLDEQKEETLSNPEESADEDKNWVTDALQNYLILRLQTLLEHRMIEFISIKRLGNIIREYLEIKVNPIENWNCSWKKLAKRWAKLGCFILENEKLFPNKESLDKMKEMKSPHGSNKMTTRQFLKTICSDQTVPQPRDDSANLLESDNDDTICSDQIVPQPRVDSVNLLESDNDDVESVYEDDLFVCNIEQIPAEESHFVDENELFNPGDYSPKNPVPAPKACIVTPRASKSVSTKLSNDE